MTDPRANPGGPTGQAVAAAAAKRAPAAAAVGAAVCAFVAAVFVGLAAVPAGSQIGAVTFIWLVSRAWKPYIYFRIRNSPPILIKIF